MCHKACCGNQNDRDAGDEVSTGRHWASLLIKAIDKYPAERQERVPGWREGEEKVAHG